ncbi:MAG: CehA/McbA family metallohydrolase, partial [Myxococcota bacterium]
TTGEGAPVTQVRPAADGRFSLRAPAGRYELRAITSDGRERRRRFAVDGMPLTLEPIALGPPATLRLPRGETLQLVFVGEGDTPSPLFGDDLLGFRVNDEAIPAGGATNTISLAAHAEDPTEVHLAPGTYRVFATRGLEYTLHEARVTLAAGEVKTLEIATPTRSVATPGWIAADMHVHSAESFDASWPLGRQLSAFAAMGAEVLVATEHDRIFDPRPELLRLGLGDRMVALTGVEVTSAFTGGESPHTIGHFNAYPMRRDPLAFRGGAPRAEGRRLRAVLADLRGDGAPFVQLNHSRGQLAHSGGEGAYFSHLGVVGEPYDPTRPLTEAPNRVLLERDPATGLRDLDFHGIELLNGQNLDRFRLIRADWLSLLLQGEVRVGIGNSDTHRAGEPAAVPRTYVALADDDVAAFDEGAFFGALRAGRAFATTGPMLSVRLGEAGPGEHFQGREGRLHVTVTAAPWVPVDRVLVHRNGEIVVARHVEPGVELTLPLRFARDGFVVVEAEGAPSDPWSAVLPGFTPLAITNPIFVDADGDGVWSAPGLPDPAPSLLGDPLRSGLLEENP